MDALGSTLALTNENGTEHTNHIYDPFDNPTTCRASDVNNQQCTGRETDRTVLQYNQARYASKYNWHYGVREGVLASPVGEVLVFEVQPTTAFGFGSGGESQPSGCGTLGRLVPSSLLTLAQQLQNDGLIQA